MPGGLFLYLFFLINVKLTTLSKVRQIYILRT